MATDLLGISRGQCKERRDEDHRPTFQHERVDRLDHLKVRTVVFYDSQSASLMTPSSNE